MTLRLRPGLAAVRRDDLHLQVGLEAPRRAVLRDLPEVRKLLADLRHGREPGPLPPSAEAALARLEQADLLAPPSAAPPQLAVVVSGPRALTDLVAARLRDAGLRAADEGPVHLLLAHGAVRRDLADSLLRAGVAHLAAAATPWGWELGPFVVPGETACLRCVDAARGERDPRHGVVVDQLAKAATPPELSAPTLMIGLSWVARDLLAFARGERPTTWSTTVRLDESPGEDLAAEQHWLRHPHCGCAWDALTG